MFRLAHGEQWHLDEPSCPRHRAAPRSDTMVALALISGAGLVWGIAGAASMLVLVAVSSRLAVGAHTLCRQVRRARLLADLLPHLAVSDPRTERCAHALGLDVTIVDHVSPMALTVGLWTPQVVATTTLVRRLTTDQLVAVLAHEAHHARRRDPLRMALVRTLAAMTGAPSNPGEWSRRAIARMELCADRSAAQVASPHAVRGALRVAVGPELVSHRSAGALGHAAWGGLGGATGSVP